LSSTDCAKVIHHCSYQKWHGRNTSMTESMQKFKDTVHATKTIAVSVGNTTDITKILSGAMLEHAFLKLGKNTSLAIKNLNEKTQNFLEILLDKKMGHGKTIPENMIIKIDTQKVPISELKYEKEGTILKIILQGNASLNASDFLFEKERVPVDLLMLVDPHEKEVEALLQETPHKDVVKLTSKERCLAEKLSDILLALFDEVPKELASPLWMLLEREEKEDTFVNAKEILSLKSKVLELGIDREKITKAREVFLNQKFWKLLGRALARSEFEVDPGIVWTFIPQRDFQKTSQDAGVAIGIFEEMRHLRPEGNFFAMLWESAPKSIEAIIGGRNIEKLHAVAGALGSTLSSSYFFLNGFSNFSEAEIKIRASIRKAIE